jgi:hypothetical protein
VPGTPAAAFALLDDPTGTVDASARFDVDGDPLSAAVADAFAQAVTAEMSGRPRWVRAHDDILPARGDRRRGLFRRR